jgi:hypothetical protein
MDVLTALHEMLGKSLLEMLKDRSGWTLEQNEAGDELQKKLEDLKLLIEGPERPTTLTKEST